MERNKEPQSANLLAGCPVVALDVEVRGGKVVELGLASPQGSRCYRDEAGIRRALERLQERAPLVVGHNLKVWDLPALERQFQGLGPWRFPVVDTLEWQARLSPWRANLALAAAHRADADAGLVLELFARQLGLLARAGLLSHTERSAGSGRIAAEAGLSGVMGLAGSTARAGLDEFRPELEALALENLDTDRLSALPDPETYLEPDGVHPWLVRIEQRMREWDKGIGEKQGCDPESNSSPGTGHALLVVLPPFLLRAFAARGQRVVLGKSGDLCLRESRLAWRAWSTGHGLSMKAIHTLSRPAGRETAHCMGCPESGCPAHPERLVHWGVSWQELDEPDVIRFLTEHPPAKVIHVGGDVATGWSWREHGRFADGQLAGAGLLTASFSLGSGPRSRLHVKADTARDLLSSAKALDWTVTGPLTAPAVVPQRSWFLERVRPGEIALKSVMTEPVELASALGVSSPEGISGLLDYKVSQPVRLLCPVADAEGTKPDSQQAVPISPGSPLRAEYWADVLPRLLPLLGDTPVLFALRLPEEVEPIRRVLAEACSAIHVVEDVDVGSLIRRLRRMPGALGLIAAAHLDELPGLEPDGITLVLECIDPDGTPVIHTPRSASLEEREQDSHDLTWMEEETPEQDSGQGRSREGPIPTGWRRRGTDLWLRRLGHQLLDFTAAGGGDAWLLDARRVSAPPVGLSLMRHPMPAQRATDLLKESLAREFSTDTSVLQTVPEDWQSLFERAFLAGRGENGGPGRFRPEQLDYLERVLRGEHDQIVSLPTGGGKSLVFQCPALLMGSRSGRLTVVVAPLRALMSDQVAALMRLGVVGVVEAITGDMDPFERQDAYQRLAGGELWMIYVSPERFRSRGFLRALEKRLERDGGAQYWVFDEAHCISQWGLDFRPDYWSAAHTVAKLRRQSSHYSPVMLLSATLSDQAMTELDGIFRREP